MKYPVPGANRSRMVLGLLLVCALLLGAQAVAWAQSPDRNSRTETLRPAAEQPVFDSQFEAIPNGVTKKGEKLRADRLVSVFVKLDFEPLATYQGGVAGLAPTSPTLTGAAKLDAKSESSQSYLAYVDGRIDAFGAAANQAVPVATLVHRYQAVLGGVSMVLPESQVAALRALPGVLAIYPDTLEQLQTDVSGAFIGADTVWDALGGQSSAGEGVVVGVLDSGIWPEHPSLADPDPLGKAYGAPPGGPYSCEFGNTAWNAADAPFTCNNKLIGAYARINTYKAVIGLLPEEFDSARDDNGHGTHTATTAAGNAAVDATLLGVARGKVSGVAPRAHIIAYRVCGDAGCFGTDSVSAINQAILDGVDVTNFSISGGGTPYTDLVEMAFLDAYAAGLFPAASAGNSGPGADTVAHRGPWVTTVGASTTDRAFVSTVTLTGTLTGSATVETLVLEGASVTAGIDTPTSVIFPPAGKEQCDNNTATPTVADPFPSGTFSGEIVICTRGGFARVEKGFNVLAGGAGGMLLYNPTLQGLATDNHFLPAVHLENNSGADLLAFMNTHTDVVATFSDSTADSAQGDVMAAFSSRGGPGQTLGISKPDITAPGVQILAGHTPLPATPVGGEPGQLFQSIQGTSMSGPHIAGAAALLKALHPTWTPGQIKSAIMTSAELAVTKEDGTSQATPFDYGSGRVNLHAAGDPGLTISASATDFITYEDALWDANYPSLYVPQMPGTITVQRTVHSELDHFSVWTTSVVAPSDVSVSVPNLIAVEAGADATFEITVEASDVPIGQVRHAWLYLDSGAYRLSFPITIVRRQPSVTLTKLCDATLLSLSQVAECAVTVTNTALQDAQFHLMDRMSTKVTLLPESVNGALVDGNGFYLHGGLSAASPPGVDVAIDPLASPAGYLGLAPFSPLVVAATDETISNYNVPAFSFAGTTYSRIGVVSNGYVVVGGGTGADVNFINSDLPDPARPNNVLAPFWTDLNPVFGGRVLIGTLTDGTNSWIVVEWEKVHTYGDGTPNTFQVWISYTRPNDVSFVYGPDITTGDGGFLTVGAENDSGTSGGTVYFNGAGTPPSPSYPNGDFEVDVLAVPGAPGESRTVTYQAMASALWDWYNVAELTSPAFAGTNVAPVHGTNVLSAGEIQVSATPNVAQAKSNVTLSAMVTDTVGGAMADQLVIFTNGTLSANLSGVNEVPPVTNTLASGVAIFTVDLLNSSADAVQVHYSLDVTDIVSVTMAHIHRGEAGTNGPAVYWLCDSRGTATPMAPPCDFPVEGDLTLSFADVVLGLQGGLYVNVHTTTYGGGEVRGQIGGMKYAVTGAGGMATSTWTRPDAGMEFIFAFTPAVVDGKESAIGAATSVRFYEVGDLSVMADPEVAAVGSDVTVTAMVTDTGNLPAPNTMVYFTTGELTADLTGDQEVPPVTTSASGSATFNVDLATGRVDFTLDATDILSVTMAHIHTAPRGVNGGVSYWLCDSRGTATPAAEPCDFPVTGSFTATMPAIKNMIAGNTYANIHTTTYGGGEIRGQIEGGKVATTGADGKASVSWSAADPGQVTVYALAGDLMASTDILFTLSMARVAVAHLAPFAMGAATAVTVTVDGMVLLPNFAYGDSTGYVSVPAGEHTVAAYVAGSASPVLSTTVTLAMNTDYSVIAIGGAKGWPLNLLILTDDNTAPANGSVKVRIGHLAPFAAGSDATLADVRGQDGSLVLGNLDYGSVSGYLTLPATTYDLKVTSAGGATTLVDPAAVALTSGQIVTLLAVGDGANQPVRVFAWPSDQAGSMLPLAQQKIYAPLAMK